MEDHRRRRDFTRTREPRGEIRDVGQARFVVQEHHAQRLHDDFRLEICGVLRSWAVPKGPPLRPGERRLAMEVEDHPVDYVDFEGTIPPGQYGAGTVRIWDQGSFAVERLQPDELRFVPHRHRLTGPYALVRMECRPGDWLLLQLADHRGER